MRRPFLREGFSTPPAWGYRARRFASPRRPAERCGRRSVRMADSIASICCRRATIHSSHGGRFQDVRGQQPASGCRALLVARHRAESGHRGGISGSKYRGFAAGEAVGGAGHGDLVGKGAGHSAERTAIPTAGAALAGGERRRNRRAAERSAAGRGWRTERGGDAHQRFGLPAGWGDEYRSGLQRTELCAGGGCDRRISGAGGAV